jgi:hypothetical protein
MTSNVTALKKVEQTEAPAVDPLREALRLSIDGHRSVVAQVAAIEQAIERAWQALQETDRALEKADEELVEARQSDVRTLAIATRKGKKVVPSATKSARENKIDLEDRIEIERGALQALRQELAELKRQEVFAEAAIIAARNRLVEPLLANVSSDYLDATARAMVAAATMSALATALDEPPKGFRNLEGYDQMKVRELLAASHTDTNEVIRTGRSAPDFNETKKQIFERVHASFTDLLTNPDAPLPEI